MPTIESFYLIAVARCSSTMMKNRGERGQPCLVSLEILICSEEDPLTNTEAEGWEYNDIILVMKALPILSCSNDNQRNCQFTQSNTFSASKDSKQAFRPCFR